MTFPLETYEELDDDPDVNNAPEDVEEDDDESSDDGFDEDEDE